MTHSAAICVNGASRWCSQAQWTWPNHGGERTEQQREGQQCVRVFPRFSFWPLRLTRRVRSKGRAKRPAEPWARTGGHNENGSGAAL